MILTLYLTLNCNQRCAYCYAVPHQDAEMTLETAKRGIELTAQRLVETDDRSLGIRFFGGEPLLVWALIPKLVDFSYDVAKKYNLDVSFAIATNGTLLTEEHCDYFLTHDFAVGISIDGPEAVHNRNRKCIDGSGSFSKTIGKAWMAIQKNLRVELVLVSDPSTISDIPQSVRYLHEETGGSFFTVSFNIHTTWSHADLLHLETAYHELGDLYIELFTQGHPIQIDFLNNKMNVLIRGGFIQEYLCEIGKTDLAIIPDGTIYPCLRLAVMDIQGITVIGNVEKGLDFDLIKNLKKMVENRFNKSLFPEVCRECEFPQSCLNWCAAANLAMTGDPSRVGEIMCAHERISVAVAKRVIGCIDMSIYEALYAQYLKPFINQHMPPATPHGEVNVKRF